MLMHKISSGTIITYINLYYSIMIFWVNLETAVGALVDNSQSPKEQDGKFKSMHTNISTHTQILVIQARRPVSKMPTHWQWVLHYTNNDHASLNVKAGYKRGWPGQKHYAGFEQTWWYGKVGLKCKQSRRIFHNESSSKLTLKCSQLLCTSSYLTNNWQVWLLAWAPPFYSACVSTRVHN